MRFIHNYVHNRNQRILEKKFHSTLPFKPSPKLNTKIAHDLLFAVKLNNFVGKNISRVVLRHRHIQNPNKLGCKYVSASPNISTGHWTMSDKKNRVMSDKICFTTGTVVRREVKKNYISYRRLKTRKHSVSIVSMFYFLRLCKTLVVKTSKVDIIIKMSTFIILLYDLFDPTFVYCYSFSSRMVNKMFCYEIVCVRL